VQNLLSSSLLSKNLKIKIYRTIILCVVLYECETWSLASREEHKLRVFENRVLRRVFGPKREEVMEELRRVHNGSFMLCTCVQIFWLSGQEEKICGACDVYGKRERFVQQGFGGET